MHWVSVVLHSVQHVTVYQAVYPSMVLRCKVAEGTNSRGFTVKAGEWVQSSIQAGIFNCIGCRQTDNSVC